MNTTTTPPINVNTVFMNIYLLVYEHVCKHFCKQKSLEKTLKREPIKKNSI